MSRWEIAIFVALIALSFAVLCFGAYRAVQKDAASPAPCSDYRDTPIRNVPLRCFPTTP